VTGLEMKMNREWVTLMRCGYRSLWGRKRHAAQKRLGRFYHRRKGQYRLAISYFVVNYFGKERKSHENHDTTRRNPGMSA